MPNHNYYVYITTNPHKTVLYTGLTNDLRRRIIEHFNNRGNKNLFAGKYYCYYLKTPKYLFPKDEWFNEKIEGQTLILLWYNREYLLKKNQVYNCK